MAIVDAALLALAIVLIIAALGSAVVLTGAVHRRIIKNRKDARDQEIERLERELGQGG